ncbi:MAG: amylo-alpha-1,6-glucosidase, partial [Verrucomicrobiota bacterium]
AAPVYALQRISAEEKDSVLVLVNNDTEREQIFSLGEKTYKELGEPLIDLLDQPPLQPARIDGKISFTLKPGAAYCLSALPTPAGLSGDNYRRAKTQAAWAISAMSKVFSSEEIGSRDWRDLAKQVDESPQKFLAAVIAPSKRSANLSEAKIKKSAVISGDAVTNFSQVITWTLLDRNRITLIPPNHWLLLQDSVPFRATLRISNTDPLQRAESVQVSYGHVACFAPNEVFLGDRAKLTLERYAPENQMIEAKVQFLPPQATFKIPEANKLTSELVLLTNGIGGMARMCVDLGRVTSKYDCVLGANLHATLPTDRHVFAKRIRVWLNADGFITPLDLQNLAHFSPGPPAVWNFAAKVGDQRIVEIKLTADMLEGKNTTVFRFENCISRREEALTEKSAIENRLSKINQSLLTSADTREMNLNLTIRVDIEDRNFHTETHRNPDTENHFATHCQPLQNQTGFVFTPARNRELRVFADSGFYHHEAEWSENIPHPIEQSRGQVGSGDAYSPGWFELPLQKEKSVSLVVCADAVDPSSEMVQEFSANRLVETKLVLNRAKFPEDDSFGRQLALAARQFVVRRGAGKTVIAGYPWFLDWGRDSLIAARGLLAAGLVSDVTELLKTFGRFVENGTMPNTIQGDDASNRDTSDAPLWFGIVCEEAAALLKENLYTLVVDKHGRTIADVLREIAVGYIRGTPNGIKMDAASALIWSPSHFTWMDTNHPAGTSREGYPIEIQVLWIRLLRQLEKLDRNHSSPGLRPPSPLHPMERRGQGEEWPNLSELANRAEASLQKYFWLEEHGYFSDLLIAWRGQSAAEAIVDDALRSNFLFAISFEFITGERAQRSVEAALRYLVVPGALRTLAPLPVKVPLPIYGNGNVLNNPHEPYCGSYEGDEDTRRKLAYHNGTAWTWTFPIFCEALARAWNFSP